MSPEISFLSPIQFPKIFLPFNVNARVYSCLCSLWSTSFRFYRTHLFGTWIKKCAAKSPVVSDDSVYRSPSSSLQRFLRLKVPDGLNKTQRKRERERNN